LFTFRLAVELSASVLGVAHVRTVRVSIAPQ
jgi:hypothetical protein